MPVQSRTRRGMTMVATIAEDSPLEDATLGNQRRGGLKRDTAKESSTTPAANGTAAKKKSVHWNHKVEKKRHHRLRDLTEEEKEAVWYTENDTKIILAMAKVTVKMMMKGEPCDDVDYCSRGLEGKTPAGSKRRQKNKLKVRKAVLEEQSIQREEGVSDGEYLGQISRKHSKDVVNQAHETALADEEDIQEYLSLMDADCSPIQPRRIKR